MKACTYTVVELPQCSGEGKIQKLKVRSFITVLRQKDPQELGSLQIPIKVENLEFIYCQLRL